MINLYYEKQRLREDVRSAMKEYLRSAKPEAIREYIPFLSEMDKFFALENIPAPVIGKSEFWKWYTAQFKDRLDRAAPQFTEAARYAESVLDLIDAERKFEKIPYGENTSSFHPEAIKRSIKLMRKMSQSELISVGGKMTEDRSYLTYVKSEIFSELAKQISLKYEGDFTEESVAISYASLEEMFKYNYTMNIAGSMSKLEKKILKHQMSENTLLKLVSLGAISGPTIVRLVKTLDDFEGAKKTYESLPENLRLKWSHSWKFVRKHLLKRAYTFDEMKYCYEQGVYGEHKITMLETCKGKASNLKELAWVSGQIDELSD